MKMQQVMRQERETIMELKGRCPDKRIPPGLLMKGSDALNNGKAMFLTQQPWILSSLRRNLI